MSNSRVFKKIPVLFRKSGKCSFRAGARNATHLKGGFAAGDFFVIILYCIFEKHNSKINALDYHFLFVSLVFFGADRF
jgi:hypothetical protein